MEILEYKCVKLKELRLEQGYTQKQLAYLMHISVNKLSMLENLSLTANIYKMASLTYFLKAKADYITGESSIKRFPEDLPYDEYDNYIKNHDKLKSIKK